MKKHILLLVVLFLPLMTMADDQSGTCGENLTWTYVEATKTLTISGSGAMTNYTSSSSVPWYKIRGAIQTINIEEGVSSIGDFAFYYCTALTSISIPNGITSIGRNAFDYCRQLTSFTIPNSVISIGDYAFEGCTGLASFTIPSSVVSIGVNPFRGCVRSVVNVEDGNPMYDSRNNCNAIIDTYNKKLIAGFNTTVIPNGVTTICQEAFYYCEFTTINIPNSVTTIESGAFSYCKALTSIIIPKSVTNPGVGYAFGGCDNLASIKVENGNPVYDSRNNCNAIIETYSNLLLKGCKSTVIPNGVEVIGYRAFEFYSKEALTIIIPSTVRFIGHEAFRCNSNAIKELKLLATTPPEANNLGTVNTSIPLYVPESSIEAYKSTAPWSNFTSIQAVSDKTDNGSCGNGLTWTYSEATNTLTISGNGYVEESNSESYPWHQYRSDIQAVIIEFGARSIGSYAFEQCVNMKSISIPTSVAYIGDGAFAECTKLSFVDIPDRVQTIEGYTFRGCSNLSSVTISISVTTIDESAFEMCSNLAAINIPQRVAFIDKSAFWGCAGLTSINVENGNQTYDSRCNCNALIETATNTLIQGCMNTIIPYGVVTIGDNAFNRCSRLTTINIPNSVISIDHGAFTNCSGLTTIKTPSSVTSIGDAAFSGCGGLTSINFSDGLTSIGNGAFSGCSKLSSICIPNSVTSIGNSVVSNCPNLTSIIVGSGNTKYDSRDNCDAIIETATNVLIAGCKNTIIPNSVVSIGESAFRSCYSLTSIVIPSSVTSIGNSAFYYCSGLNTVTLSNGLTTIGEYAFDGCSKLPSITLPESLTTIGKYAFQYLSALKTIEVLATTPPEADTKSFGNYKMPLYVPGAAYSSYKTTAPWSSFTDILPIEDSGTMKCEKPTITVSGGTLKLSCATPDVKFVPNIVYSSGTIGGDGSEIALSGTTKCHISVYATKEGYRNSDIATADVELSVGKQGDVNADGKVTITDAVGVVNIILNSVEVSAPVLQDEQDIQEPE